MGKEVIRKKTRSFTFTLIVNGNSPIGYYRSNKITDRELFVTAPKHTRMRTSAIPHLQTHTVQKARSIDMNS